MVIELVLMLGMFERLCVPGQNGIERVFSLEALVVLLLHAGPEVSVVSPVSPVSSLLVVKLVKGL